MPIETLAQFLLLIAIAGGGPVVLTAAAVIGLYGWWAHYICRKDRGRRVRYLMVLAVAFGSAAVAFEHSFYLWLWMRQFGLLVEAEPALLATSFSVWDALHLIAIRALLWASGQLAVMAVARSFGVAVLAWAWMTVSVASGGAAMAVAVWG